MDILILVLIVIFFHFLSWTFSGFEIGLISLDRLRLEQDAKKSKHKKKILDFYDNSDKSLGTTLIGNTIANVVIATLSTYIYCEILGFSDLTSSLITTFIVLIFCEIFPKNLFRDYSEKLVSAFLPLVNTCYILLKPLVKIVTFINKTLKKLYNIDDKNNFSAFTKDDISYIVAETFNEGQIQKPQKEMLEEALEFNELITKKVMTPRTEIVAIPDDMTYTEILKFAKQEGYTRYPVYHETLDEITGVLIIYDLLKCKKKDIIAKDIQREMFYVPETMDVDVLLKEMQTHKKSIACVVDSFGGTSGLVTIEDILEEIVGEIEDEYDIDEVKDVEKIDNNTWLVNAFVEVDTLNDDYELNLPVGDYETIAGLIIAHLARIPSKGQKVKIGDYKLEILEVTNRSIKKVKITRLTDNV